LEVSLAGIELKGVQAGIELKGVQVISEFLVKFFEFVGKLHNFVVDFFS